MDLPPIYEEEGQDDSAKAEDFRSLFVRSKHVSKWKKAHKTRHVSQDDPFVNLLRDHAFLFRSNIPLPLLFVMEKDLHCILKHVMREYCEIVGPEDDFTLKIKENILRLENSLQTKSLTDLVFEDEDEEQQKVITSPIWNWIIVSVIKPLKNIFWD